MLCLDCFQEKNDAKTCPRCGFDEATETDFQRLPLRSELKNGAYTVGKVLGHGGFGITYRALENTKYKALVVIKECLIGEKKQEIRGSNGRTVVVSESLQGTYREWLKQFYEEAVTISKLNHPNVVRIIDFFYENNTAYYVMPLVDGEDLREHLRKQGGKISERELMPIALRLVSALAGLHAKGILHRDIKPQNIILTRTSHDPVLIDFGSAKNYLGHNKVFLAAHTDGYAPYEQVVNSSKQGPWTDIYSVSATLYRCLTSIVPTPADKRIDKHGKDSFTPIEIQEPTVTPSLARVINRGLAFNERNRIQTAEDLLAQLQKCIPGGNEPIRNGSKEDPDSHWRTANKLTISELRSYRAPTLWFVPTMLVASGIFATENAINYFAFVFMPVGMINLIAWSLLFRHINIWGQSPVGEGSFIDRSGVSDQRKTKNHGKLRFLGNQMAGSVHSFEESKSLIIGRSPPSDIIIPDRCLSKQHVKVTFRSNSFEVIDLNSTNGTFIVAADKYGKRRVSRIQRHVGTGVFLIGGTDAAGLRFECLVDQQQS